MKRTRRLWLPTVVYFLGLLFIAFICLRLVGIESPFNALLTAGACALTVFVLTPELGLVSLLEYMDRRKRHRRDARAPGR